MIKTFNTMSEPSSKESLIRYYCTAGNGMERFLIDEVKKKLSAKDVCQVSGKVLFSSSVKISRVVELKAAERLFLLLKQDSAVHLSAHISPAKAAAVLQSRLLGDRNQWTCALMTWNCLQGELSNRQSTTNTTNPAFVGESEEVRGNEGQTEKEKPNVDTMRNKGVQKEEENRSLRSGELNEKQTLEKRDMENKGVEEVREEESQWKEEKNDEQYFTETMKKKRKRDEHDNDVGEEEKEEGNAQESCSEESVKKKMTSNRQRVTAEEEQRGVPVDNSSFKNNDEPAVILGIKFNNRDHNKDFPVQKKTYGGSDETPLQSSKPQSPTVPVSFRISCKCTGSLSRYFSSQEVSKVIGVGLSRLMGWKVDLKNPQLEVNVHLSDDQCLLGIPLTRLPLANRCYIKTTGLRSTVAWAMASLAQIQPGFCVVDPMCGVGTILVEAAQEHKTACFLGMDIDDGQLKKANENVEFSELGNRIHLLKASSMALPLPSASVDAIVCDLPFGKKFGTKTNMAANLPLILTEMERVLHVGGSLVLLLSPQLSCLLKKFLAQKETGPMPSRGTKPATRIQVSPSPSPSSTKQQTFQIDQQANSPPIQETGPQCGPMHSLPLSSLTHQATLRVNLGLIDGLILKYVKMET
ncbi:THUMP domain-containing protein 2 [Xyrichtys novacula]|uniref:THUMP domain-containing protein 2 n=1 Tax=Xyrichtys novacula TaxID=13765 RepID=A0AAV1FZV5_XYRNO|nr:THUMP domain-containing protein 2 [Xyrichtys novacula]